MCEFLVVCIAVFIQCVCDAFAFAVVYFLLGEVTVNLDNCIVFSLFPRQVATCHLAK